MIGMLEGMAYIWERGQANSLYAWELVASRRLVWEKFPAPGAGYTLMKPGSHYEWQGIPVDVNSHGLRSPETTLDKPLAVLRILNLGDSSVMGWGVRLEDTFGQQLEESLNRQNNLSDRVEVINAGVPGWNLENALAYLQDEGIKFDPDLVILAMSMSNDINGDSALLARGRPAPIEWLRAKTYFWPFLTVQMRWMAARAAGRDRPDEILPPANPAKYFPQEPASVRWEEIWQNVSAIQHIAAENGSPMVIVLLPVEFQVVDESFPTLAQEILTARAGEAGIQVLDMLPVFRQACSQKPGDACQLEDRYLFADVWMHPSALGHRLIADEIESMIAGLLPR